MADFDKLKYLLAKRRGVSLTGYGLLLGLVAVGALTAVSTTGDSITALFSTTAEKLDGAASGTSSEGSTGSSGGEGGAATPDFVVTTLTDESFDGSESIGTPDGSGLSLREAIGIAGAGQLIGFDAGLAGGTITLNSELSLPTSGVDIEGGANNITLSGNDTNRVFNISGPATISNITISNGRCDKDVVPSCIDGSGYANGGAVYVSGATAVVTLDNVTIQNSNAYGEYSGGYRGLGGGLFAGGNASVTITNSTITGNSTYDGNLYSYGYGGGLAVWGGATLNVSDSTVSGNDTYASGGGIHAYESGTNIILNNVTVSSNTASQGGGGGGGGLYMGYGVTGDVDNSTFQSNIASDGGGLMNRFANVTIDNTDFTQNQAEYRGGALFNVGGGVGATITMTGGSITLNQGGTAGVSYGGGVQTQGNNSYTSLTNVAVTGNSVTGTGGGVAVTSKGTTVITGGSVSSNTATGNGGGLYADDPGGGLFPPASITTNGTTISGNSSPETYQSNAGVITINPCIAFFLMAGLGSGILF